MNYLIVKENNKAVIYKNGIKLFNKKFTSMKKACEWLRETDAEYVEYVNRNMAKLNSYK